MVLPPFGRDAPEYIRRCEQLCAAIPQQNHQGKLVLVIDADEEMRGLLSDCLGEMGLQVATAANGNGALDEMTPLQPHVILTDLPRRANGFDHVRTLQARWASCPIILLTALGSHEAKDQAMALGVPFFSKPIRVSDLQRAVLAVLDGQWKPGTER